MPRPSWSRRYTTTPPCSGDLGQRGVELAAAVAAQRAEGVAGQALRVQPGDGVRCGRVAADQRDVLGAGDQVAVAVHGELAVPGGQHGRRLAPHPRDGLRPLRPDVVVRRPPGGELGDADRDAGRARRRGAAARAAASSRRRPGRPRRSPRPGASPASRHRSIAASVWPGRSSTPPSRARSGRRCPGRTRSWAVDDGSASSCSVRARSAALMPVLTPSRASTETVYAVRSVSWLSTTIGGRPSRSAHCAGIGAHR